jgi:NAD(P)-dependent dehydrogenase (short-subunit alcohol dehydrogenase family)
MNMDTPRTLVITGSASGIGAALCRYLIERGHNVIGVDLRNADLIADLADPAQRASLADRIGQLCPALDGVVACAGVSPPMNPATVVSVNYFGVADLLARLLPLLHRSRAPRAAAICSSASLLPVDDALVERCLAGDEAGARARATAVGELCYSSSKRALTRWIRRTSTGADWAGRGVLLNGISPGGVKTPMTAPLLATAEGRELLAQSVPLAMQDYAEPEDLAPLLAFLSGPDNRYLVGQVPFVDGGTDVLLRGEEPL